MLIANKYDLEKLRKVSSKLTKRQMIYFLICLLSQEKIPYAEIINLLAEVNVEAKRHDIYNALNYADADIYIRSSGCKFLGIGKGFNKILHERCIEAAIPANYMHLQPLYKNPYKQESSFLKKEEPMEKVLTEVGKLKAEVEMRAKEVMELRASMLTKQDLLEALREHDRSMKALDELLDGVKSLSPVHLEVIKTLVKGLKNG